MNDTILDKLTTFSVSDYDLIYSRTRHGPCAAIAYEESCQIRYRHATLGQKIPPLSEDLVASCMAERQSGQNHPKSFMRPATKVVTSCVRAAKRPVSVP